MSSFFKLNTEDLIKGLCVAVAAVVLGSVKEAVVAHGFDFAMYDWGMIFNLAWQAGGAYLIKNLLTTRDGMVLGVINTKKY